MLNSFIGKFGQRDKFPSKEFINIKKNPHKLNEIIFDDRYKSSITILTDKIVKINYEEKEDNIVDPLVDYPDVTINDNNTHIIENINFTEINRWNRRRATNNTFLSENENI